MLHNSNPLVLLQGKKVAIAANEKLDPAFNGTLDNTVIGLIISNDPYCRAGMDDRSRLFEQ